MRRFGQVIRVRPEAEEEYKKIHGFSTLIWPKRILELFSILRILKPIMPFT